MSIDIIARGLAAKALAGGGGSPGGSPTQFQFNNAGALGGTSGFTWDSANQIVALAPAAFTLALSALSINPTWNNGAVAFPGALVVNPTDTASGALSALADFQVGGVSQFKFLKNSTLAANSGQSFPPYMMFASNAFYFGAGSPVSGNNRAAIIGNGSYQVVSGGRFAWTNSASNPDTTIDVMLYRDAAATMALRNGVNAQTFNIYNTYTDASNYERGSASWSDVANNFMIGVEAAGTGVTTRSMGISGYLVDIYTGSGSSISGSSSRWRWDQNGHFIALADNAYDIGALGANRPRNIYAGSAVLAAGYVAGSYFRDAGNNIHIYGVAGGHITLYNAAETGFGRLSFGGTTASYPALKRSSTTLQARLADDTAFATIQGKLQTDNAYTAGAPTATGYVTIYDSAGTPYKVLVST